ncbi:hypothetical protein NESM_000071900 [Novymonas esmeraldas]|uniref:Uncharacterized protein n=1 Tax=Novymonas esmeraldas TaxID=1808958 RepID=A0AAW0F220_9TRYP
MRALVDVGARVDAVELGMLEFYAANIYSPAPQRVSAAVTRRINNALRSAVETSLQHLRALRVGNSNRLTLRLMKPLPRLTELCIHSLPWSVLPLRTFACAASLMTLSLVGASVRKLSGLEACHSLVQVNLLHCPKRAISRRSRERHATAVHLRSGWWRGERRRACRQRHFGVPALLRVLAAHESRAACRCASPANADGDALQRVCHRGTRDVSAVGKR